MSVKSHENFISEGKILNQFKDNIKNFKYNLNKDKYDKNLKLYTSKIEKLNSKIDNFKFQKAKAYAKAILKIEEDLFKQLYKETGMDINSTEKKSIIAKYQKDLHSIEYKIEDDLDNIPEDSSNYKELYDLINIMNTNIQSVK